MKNELKIVAKREFSYNNEIYKIVDFINKNLSKTNLVLGLTQKGDKSILTLYEEG